MEVECETYHQMVDDEMNSATPIFPSLNEDIKEVKETVLENFKSILDVRCEVLKVVKGDQHSYTFINSEGTKRTAPGVYVTDGYRDTMEDGIAIVEECIESLADNAKTESLAGMVLKLLARDARSTSKVSRIVQPHKITEESNNDRFMEGVRVIEEVYQPAIGKQFVRMEMKDGDGIWVTTPSGVTRA